MAPQGVTHLFGEDGDVIVEGVGGADVAVIGHAGEVGVGEGGDVAVIGHAREMGVGQTGHVARGTGGQLTLLKHQRQQGKQRVAGHTQLTHRVNTRLTHTFNTHTQSTE